MPSPTKCADSPALRVLPHYMRRNRCGWCAIVIHMLLFLIFAIGLMVPAFAQTKSFIREYAYQASEADSKLTSRAIALDQVKRLLLEELGTYLESTTEVVDFKLTKEQIISLSAGIVQTAILDEKWDGEKYWLKAKMDSDPEDVVRKLGHLRKDRQRLNDMEDARRRTEAALKENERLRKELALLKSQHHSKQEQLHTQKAYNESVQKLTAVDSFEKGNQSFNRGNYQDAIVMYSKAIQIDPAYAAAYTNRGWAYDNLRDYTRAIVDFNKALSLNPDYALAYAGRGWAHVNTGSTTQAIKDFDAAIIRDPSFASAYGGRGGAYHNLANPTRDKGLYERAIKDYDSAVHLDPNFSWAYYNRGWAHANIGNENTARADMRTAARLGYVPAQEWLRMRGERW